MSIGSAPPPKRTVADELLAKGFVYVHLDPRLKSVRVPKWLRHDAQLVLQIGLNLPIPISDLTVDEGGIGATLSFQRAPHYCHIPWDAVFAIVGENGRGMLWPEDLPEELFREVAKEAARGHGFEALLEHYEDDVALDAPSEIRSQVASRPLRLVPQEAGAPAQAEVRAERRVAEPVSPAAAPALEQVETKRTVPSSRPSSAASTPSRPPHLRLVK
jgi:stringent starvation protein B